MTTTAIPKSVSDFMQHITDLCGTEHAAWAENFNACFAHALTTTVKRHHISAHRRYPGHVAA